MKFLFCRVKARFDHGLKHLNLTKSGRRRRRELKLVKSKTRRDRKGGKIESYVTRNFADRGDH